MSIIDWFLGKGEPETRKKVTTYGKEVRQVIVGKVTTVLHMKKGPTVVGPTFIGNVYSYDTDSGEVTGLTEARECYQNNVGYYLTAGNVVSGEKGTTVRGENIEYITFKHNPKYKLAVKMRLVTGYKYAE